MMTLSCNAVLALRMRVSMSAMGSLTMVLPARLCHSGDYALMRKLPKADAA
jgi:hypothetical protein